MAIAAAELSEALSAVVERTGKSVVRVEGGRRRPVSGVVWSANQVITVAHGVENDDVIVGFDDTELKAKVKGRDPSTDLALIEVEGTLPPAATFEDATGAKVGQIVLLLARPGVTVRASSGIVSAHGSKPWRSQRGGQIDRYLESDAVHQPGFSGGPLVTLDGKVLGLTSTGLLRGTSLAIPTPTLRRVITQLAAHGAVRRSYLGLQMQPVQLPEAVRAATNEELGLLVVSVEKGGPAEQGGLQYGDTLLHLGDDSVRTLDDLYAFLRADHVGEQVPAKYFRNGQVLTAKITLGEKPRAS